LINKSGERVFKADNIPKLILSAVSRESVLYESSGEDEAASYFSSRRLKKSLDLFPCFLFKTSKKI
jgi:hypothetical protein